MSKYEKAYIYFDTNALECRHSGKALFLSQFTVNSLYYEIEDLIHNMGLDKEVEICIPEVVWYELQEHLVNYYKSEKTSMETKIAAFRKSFGNLAEITCEFKDCVDDKEYSKYVMEIAQGFLDNPRVNAKVVPCPKDETTIQQIISQAVHSIKPFRVAKANGKEYTDAGFKDALIFNTLVKHTGEQLGIFISNDNDFDELFNNNRLANLKQCRNINDIQIILSDEFNVVSGDMIINILNTDGYLMERILSECGIDVETNIRDLQVISHEVNEDNVKVRFEVELVDIKYSFEIEYNIAAKELLNVDCELVDECVGG